MIPCDQLQNNRLGWKATISTTSLILGYFPLVPGDISEMFGSIGLSSKAVSSKLSLISASTLGNRSKGIIQCCKVINYLNQSNSSLKSERTSLRELYSLPFLPAEGGKKQKTHTNFLGYSNNILRATDNKDIVLTKCFAMPWMRTSVWQLCNVSLLLLELDYRSNPTYLRFYCVPHPTFQNRISYYLIFRLGLYISKLMLL